jgi:hypothetical protein
MRFVFLKEYLNLNMKRIKLFIKTPLGYTIFGGIIVFLFAKVFDIVFGSSIWPSIKSGFLFLCDLLNKNMEVPVWVIGLIPIVTIVLLLFAFWLIAKYQEVKKGSNTNQKSSYLDYTEDSFDGVYYRWTYVATSHNTDTPFNIKPYCFNCKCLLIINICPKCKTNYNVFVSRGGHQISETKSQQELTAIILSEIEIRYN